MPGPAGPPFHDAAPGDRSPHGRGRLRHSALPPLRARAPGCGTQRPGLLRRARKRRPPAPRALPWSRSPASGHGRRQPRPPWTRHRPPRGFPGAERPARAALRLRPRRDAPRRGAAGREPRAPGRGEPRSLDGLRSRHLPRLRGLHPGTGRGPRQVPLRLHRGPGLRRVARGVAGRRRIAGAPSAPRSKHEPRGRARGPAPQEPAGRGLGHFRLRRRVRGPHGPRPARRARVQGALPRSARRRPHPAHRGDPVRAAQRHRPARRRGARVRQGRAAPPRPLRHRGARERVRRHRRGIRRGHPHRGRRARSGGGRDQHLLPERQEGRDGVRGRSPHDRRGRDRGAQGDPASHHPQAVPERGRHHGVRAGLRRVGGRRDLLHQHPARPRRSTWTRGSLGSRSAPEASPVPRSGRSRCAWPGRPPRR